MMSDEWLLLGEPPCVLPSNDPPFFAPMPSQISHVAGIDFRHARNQDALVQCFLELIAAFKTHDDFVFRLTILEFIFGGIHPSMFPLFLESGLADLIAVGCDHLFTEHYNSFVKVTKLDSLCFGFVSRNIVPFTKLLKSNAMLNIQKVITRPPFVTCRVLLHAIYVAEQFAIWVSSSQHDLPLLRFILSAFRPPPSCLLPLPLSTEICRCLISAALVISSFPDGDLANISGDCISILGHFLELNPLSFAHPSIIWALQQVRTRRVIAVSLRESLSHPYFVPLDGFLQLVRFSLFAALFNSEKDLLHLASLCPSACGEILRQRSCLLQMILLCLLASHTVLPSILLFHSLFALLFLQVF
jgi:hypothetical protein